MKKWIDNVITKKFLGILLNKQYLILGKNVEIGNNCLIGANTLLTEGTKIPDNSLVMGSPGKVKKEVDENLKIILKRIGL